MTDWEGGRILPGQARRASRLPVSATALLITLAACLVFRSTDGHAAPALPGDLCQVEARRNWSETEKWVWRQICVGAVANLNAYFGRDLDPRSAEGWTEERKLSSVFLETILLYDPWHSAIPRQGVRIEGAWFDETVDLVEAEIADPFSMHKSRFTSDVYLHHIRTRSLLSLDGSVIIGTLDMESARIGSNLFMRQGAQFADVILLGAQVNGQLSMSGSNVSGTLDMASVDIAGSLFMHGGAEFNEVDLRSAKIGSKLSLIGAKVTGPMIMDSASIGLDLFMRDAAEFTEVILRGAQVGGQLDMSGANVTGTLNMTSASIVNSLFMGEGARFAEVDVRNAKIGGQLSLNGARVSGPLDMVSASIGDALLMGEGAEFAKVDLRNANVGELLSLNGANLTGRLNMDSARIGSDLFMRDGHFSTETNLIFAQIGGSLDLRGAALGGLDLTGTLVDGELRLASGSQISIWSEGASLVLRNARVVAVQDEPEAWPKRLDLDGFSYERLGGLGVNPEAAIGQRGSLWFVEWLARDTPYTPQPYQQAAKVLRGIGHPEMADDVLYAGRERERKEAWEREEHSRWIFLSLLKWTIGYGLGPRYFWALYWVIGLVLIGTMVLGVTGQNQRDDGTRIGIWYSLDTLLPIIQLREQHYTIDLEGRARYWFYLHRIMGYVLASFLIAGLAGLTK